ncbi:sugar fermentation stimulation protein A [Butyrivibrio proteoclasticus]|uniref:Sugar fermentation stimulation protein homolog n=1 Tax=Butyrivibrio proteoclasticus TaxID=43305 RepID=A0A1I5X8D6_9FIRM|nr:DNA/RNA nuclease SfsA [Butyrivibrio proteoclasticus]SFQ28208.1 sugar fermentation stimulation protein A [Butyrivibrio proteoclasticus]
MTYKNIVEAKFISRPNRFIAIVSVYDDEIKVHVKNTGRCKELLIPGCTVYLEKAENPERKTPYDLVAVKKDGKVINIDSQAPNKVVKEWLESVGKYSKVQPEYKYGNSRIDFYMEKEVLESIQPFLMEVKGCTLFKDGIGYFPDAPTERGTKHLKELTMALEKGIKTRVAFVIQGEGISEVRPNEETDPEFAKAFYEAKKAGVEIVFYLCEVTPDTLKIVSEKGGTV